VAQEQAVRAPPTTNPSEKEDDMEAMNPDTPAQPPMAGQETPPDAGQGSYTICIKVEGGQLSVGVDKAAAAPMGDGMEAMAETSQYAPAGSIKEALTMALDIYRNDGGMPDDAVGDAEFNAGLSNREPV
jgi:hypothetical protein